MSSLFQKAGTGFILLEEFLEHVIEIGHPESPERLIAIQKMMTETGLIEQVRGLEIVSNSLSHIHEIHSQSHIDAIAAIPKSGSIANLAVASALGAVQAVCEGQVRNAFCALRPPGHHANNNGNLDGLGAGEGFCFYNNAAIAARYAQTNFYLDRVLIVDWDFHHGNGTEAAFYRDPSVFFFSTHNLYAYPTTGHSHRQGAAEGYGYNLNVPLESGSGDNEILRAFEEKLIPIADRYKPELILISAGFDSRIDDPLGDFEVTDQGFSQLTKLVMQIADRHCEGKIVSLLEGGYNITGLRSSVEAHLSALLGA